MHSPECGRDPVTEKQVRPVAAVLDWAEQRELWGRSVLAKLRN